jgi:hypothetical protein
MGNKLIYWGIGIGWAKGALCRGWRSVGRKLGILRNGLIMGCRFGKFEILAG